MIRFGLELENDVSGFMLRFEILLILEIKDIVEKAL
jgi:hypothetical protein